MMVFSMKCLRSEVSGNQIIRFLSSMGQLATPESSEVYIQNYVVNDVKGD